MNIDTKQPGGDSFRGVPQGTVDHVGRDVRVRQHIIDTIQAVYESFGFSPYETPLLENFEVVQGRYGESEGSIFHVVDKQKHHMALRFDSTVSLARLVATHPKLPRPFRAYNFGKSFRDDTNGLECRELALCSADVIGSDSLGCDAEFIVLAYHVLKKLGFADFTIRINHRKIYQDIVEMHGVRDSDQIAVIQQVIDHFDKGKQDMAGVKEELAKLGIESEIIDVLLEVLDLCGSPYYVLRQLEEMVYSRTKGVGFRGLNELKEIVTALPREVIDKTEIDMSLVQNFRYYTGSVIECSIANVSAGPVLRGGRYDDLISSFGAGVAAVGSAFYIEPIQEAMDCLGISDKLNVSRRRIFLTCTDSGQLSKLILISQALRANSLEVVTAYVPISNKFLRLKMAMDEQCSFIVILDGILRIKPLPGYGNGVLAGVLEDALSNNAYGDRGVSAVIVEEEVSQNDLEGVASMSRPSLTFNPFKEM